MSTVPLVGADGAAAKPDPCEATHDWQWLETLHTQGERKRVELHACKRCPLRKSVVIVVDYWREALGT